MSGRLAALGFAVALLFALPVRAEQSFDIGFLKLGMPLEELRAQAWPPGSRLLCGTDKDLPTMDPQARRTIEIGLMVAGKGVVPCALFGKDDDGVWRPRPILLGGTPSGFWAMGVIGDNGGPPLLAEVMMRQAKEFFDDTVTYLGRRVGPPRDANPYAAHWIDPRIELTVAHESSAGIITFLIDKELNGVVAARLNKPSKTYAPKVSGTPKDSGK